MTNVLRIGLFSTLLVLVGCGEAVVGRSRLANTPPTIDPIADVTTAEDTPVTGIPVVLTDAEDADILVVTATSSDTSIVANAGIVVSGTGPNRTVDIAPLANANGSVTITISVADKDDYVVTSTFTFTVTPVNDPPTITGLSDQTIAEDGVAGPLAFTVDDVDDPLTALVLSTSSSNTTLLPAASVVIGGAAGARTLTMTPALNQNGASTIVVTVTDVAGLTASQTIVLTVTAVNDRPVANADAATVAEGGTVNVDLAANDTDVDGTIDVASIVIVAQPQHGSVVVNANGTVDYTHDSSENFTDSFTYTIADDMALASTPGTVSLTITPVNDAPVANADTANVDEALFVDVNLAANDTDAENGLDLTSITLVTPPLHGAIVVNANGTVRYTHDGSETTSDSFTYTIDDGGAPVLGSNVATVSITINPINDAPVANDDVVTVDEGNFVTVDLSANDTDAELGIDPASIVIGTMTAHGTVMVNGDGTITYVHDGTENFADALTYTIKDVGSPVLTSNVATLTISITPVNDAPVAVNDAGTVSEAGTVNLPLSSNDTDVDNPLNPGSITVVTGPLHGTYVVNANGSVSYTHDGSETTTDSFTYTIRDTGTPVLTSNVATVSLTITPVNDAPIAVADSGLVLEGGSTNIAAAANDTDAEGALDVASIVITTPPVNGTATVNANGTIDYVHDGTETTADTISYTIEDTSNAVSNVATIAITIQPSNDAPVGNADAFTVAEGSTTALNVAANDTDAENGLNLGSISILTTALHGTLTPNAGGTVTYVHDGSETTSDSFTYTIRDAFNVASNVTTVTITVTPVNDAPVANADTATLNEGASANINLAVNDTDVDNALDLTSITIVTGATNGGVVVNANGTVTYTHNGSETTSDSFTYRIRDAAGAQSNVATVTITINPVNDAPLAVNDGVSVNEGATQTFTISSNDTDPDSPIDLASIVVVASPAHGTFVVNANGSVTYTHDGSETTTDSFTYTIKDTSGLVSNVATVSVSVNPVNDAPVANADTGNVNEGASGTFNLSANDTDPENQLDLTSITVVTPPTHGTFVVNANGSVTYTHDGSETTTDSFAYTIADSGAPTRTSNTATVSITITPVNDGPSAVNDAATVAEGGTVTFSLSANDTDPDSTVDVSTITIVAAPTRGMVTVNADGTVTYTHDGSETATDTFTYRIRDNLGANSNIAVVTMTITPVNDAPVANDDTGTVNEGASATFNLAANDVDPEASLDLTSISIGTAPLHGALTVNADGTVAYLHDGSETTTDSFTYTIEDNGLPVFTSNTATVSVTITPVNDAPVVSIGAVPAMMEDTSSSAITITITDVDDTCGTASFTLAVSSDDNTLFPPATAFTYTATATTCSRTLVLNPGANASGMATISVTATDPGGLVSAPATANVTVSAVIDDPPTAVADGTFSTTGNVSISTGANVLTNDTDPDTGDTLRVTGSANCAAAAPVEAATTAGGLVTITAAGAVTYTPKPGYTGADSFTYRVCDTINLTSTATITFSVGAPMVWFVDNDHPSKGTTALGNGGTDAHPFGTLAELSAEPNTAAGDTVYIDLAGGTSAGYNTGYTMKAGMTVVGMPLGGPPTVLTGTGATPAITFTGNGTLRHVAITGGTNGIDANTINGAISLIDVDVTGVTNAIDVVGSGASGAVTLDGVRVSGATTMGVSLDRVALTTATTNRSTRVAATSGTALSMNRVDVNAGATIDMVTLSGTTGTGVVVTTCTGSLAITTLDVNVSGTGFGVTMSGGSSLSLGTGGRISVGDGYGIAATGGTIGGTITTFSCDSTVAACVSLKNGASTLTLQDFHATAQNGFSALEIDTMTGSVTITDPTNGFADADEAPTVSLVDSANVVVQLATLDGANTTGPNIVLQNLTGTSGFSVAGTSGGARDASGGDITSGNGSAVDIDDGGTVSLSSMNLISTGDWAIEAQGATNVTLAGLDVNGANATNRGGIFVHASTGTVTMSGSRLHDAANHVVITESAAGTSSFTSTSSVFQVASADCVSMSSSGTHALTASFTGVYAGTPGTNEFSSCAAAAVRFTDTSSGAASLTLNASEFVTAANFLVANTSGGGAETLAMNNDRFTSATNDAVRWTSTGCNARNQVDVKNSVFGSLATFKSTSTNGSALELDVTGTGCTIDHEVSGNSIYGIQATNQEGLGTRYTLGGVSPAAIQILSNTIDLTPPGASLADANVAVRFASFGTTGVCFAVRGNTLDRGVGGLWDVRAGSGTGGAISRLEGWPAASPTVAGALANVVPINTPRNAAVTNTSAAAPPVDSSAGFLLPTGPGGTCVIP